MKSICGAVFLVALVGQEESIDRLIQQLGDDSIEIRERAGEMLIRIGAPARVALANVAKSADTEMSSRARSILGDIEVAENQKKAFGPAHRVTLVPGEYALAKISDIVKEQNAVTLQIPRELSNETIRIEAKNMLLWEFLERVAKAHGALAIPLDQPEGAILLTAGKPPSAPVHYSGAFRLWINRLNLERRDPFDQGWKSGSLVLGMGWQPNVRPIHSFYNDPQIEIQEIRGDDGGILKVGSPDNALYSSFTGGYEYHRAYLKYIEFEHPVSTVRRLRHIRGYVRVLLPLKIETLSFAKPLDSVGKLQKLGEYSITLKECRRNDKGVSILVHLSVSEKSGRSNREGGLELRTRFSGDDAVLLDEGKKEYPGEGGSSSHSSGGGEETLDEVITFNTDANPAEVRLKFLMESFEKRVEFEFRDVELP